MSGAGTDARARRRERRVRWAVRLGGLIVRALGATWRVREVNRGPVDEARRERRPLIFALWHGEMLPLLWHHRDEGIVVMISEHGDGEIIARIAERLGYGTVRGSTRRGAERALLGASRIVDAGRDLAVTPDGPRGPAGTFAPGALVVAQRSGAPIVPLAVAAGRAWRLRSWDRFLIPKPFARVAIVYGEPTYLTARTLRDAAAEAGALEGRMRDAARLADV